MTRAATATKPQSTALAVKPIEAVAAALDRMRPQIETALAGSSLSPDRLLRVVYTALQKTPALLDANRTSLYAAILTAAQLGLEPDGVLGMGHLVPFKGRVQFIAGYKGLVQLTRNSGEIDDVRARVVYEGDQFDYAHGLEERLYHVPTLGERGAPTHAYAVAERTNGRPPKFEVMRHDEIELIRKRAAGGNADAWTSYWPEMAKKTAIRRLSKSLPLAVQRAAALEEQHELGRVVNINKLGDIVVEGEVEEPIPVPPPTAALDEFAGMVEEQEREPGEDG